MPTPSEIKIVFFGTPDFAVPSLQTLVQSGYQVVGVITQPEKPHGRSRLLLPSPIKRAALQEGLLVLEPTSLKDDSFFETFKNLGADVCVVAAYGKIIPSRYLDSVKNGFICVHPSLLPKYRGPSPVQSSILSGDTESGVSLLKIDEQVDHGPILVSAPYAIGSERYFNEVNPHIWQLGADLLAQSLEDYIEGRISLMEQNHNQATFTKRFTFQDGHINWSEPSEKIYNLIRALSNEPGTWTTYKDKTLRIIKASRLNQDVTQKPGTVVKLEKNIAVATSSGYIVLEAIQLEGKKEVDTKSFANGYPDFIGSVLE